jgi:LysR family glycine cleavage system transcriptional activator
MLRTMPPLEAAEAFLAAANDRSFRSAAASLALSPSAFSRRVQQLERFVGVELFIRSSSRSELSAAGRDYLAEIGGAVETIRAATMSLRDRHGERRIRIATSHSLASEWLMPRLPNLLAEHGIAATIAISRNSQRLRDGTSDLGIWGGTGEADEIVSSTVAVMEAVPVSAVRLADGREPPRTLEELSKHRLLADRVSRKIWPRWLEAAGYRGVRPQIDDHFETNQLCNEAAASGLGIVLCLPMVTERFIERDHLRACVPHRFPIGASYQVHRLNRSTSQEDTIFTVTEWLQREAQKSLKRFNAWSSDSTKLLMAHA